MMARESLASPRSARFHERSKRAWRVARLVRSARRGCWVVFCSGRTQPSCLRFLASCAAAASLSWIEAGERGLIGGGVGSGLGRGKQPGDEGVRERRFFLVQLLELFLVGVREIGSSFDELLVVVFDQTQRLGVELERGALVVDSLDAREELRVEGDGVLMRGHAWGKPLLHLLKIVIGVGAGDAVEDERDTAEKPARFFKGDDGVLKCGRRGAVGDGRDFPDLLGHAGFEGGLVVRVLDLVEGSGVEGERALGIERIAGTEGGGRSGCGSLCIHRECESGKGKNGGDAQDGVIASGCCSAGNMHSAGPPKRPE